MKRFTLLSFLICLISVSLFAQQEGKIFFSETVNINFEVPEDSPIPAEELKKMMPSNQVAKRILFFNAKESLYTNAQQGDAQEDGEFQSQSESGDVTIQIKMTGMNAENKMYRDLENETALQKTDFMGKTFLIEEENPKLPWKLEAETKEILGYNCRKATAEIEDRKVEAWFTTQITIPAGPASYFGLPGMILELKSESERGGNHIQATAIQFEELEEGQIEKPKKGKKVSREEFQKIVDQKTKEMQEQMGGRGGIRIIRG